MKRRLLNILTVFSAILCVAMVVLWVRSFTYDEWVRISDRYSLRCIRGHAAFSAYGAWPLRQGFIDEATILFAEGESDFEWAISDDDLGMKSRRGALGFYITHVTLVGDQWWWVVPSWFLVALASVLPLRWLYYRWRNARYKSLNLCVVCGYDLRASAERCPECGTPVPVTVSA